MRLGWKFTQDNVRVCTHRHIFAAISDFSVRASSCFVCHFSAVTLSEMWVPKLRVYRIIFAISQNFKMCMYLCVYACVFCVYARVHAHVCIPASAWICMAGILPEMVQSINTFCAMDHMQNYFASIIPNAAKHLTIRTGDIAVTDQVQGTPSLIQIHSTRDLKDYG